MNALANSQLEELDKFIKSVPGGKPVAFARYTGQDDTEERRRISEEPPDILLTDFMMLELLMTRQDELDRRVIGNCAGLRFLVLDELAMMADLVRSENSQSPYQTRLGPPPADPRVAHPDTRPAAEKKSAR